MTETPFSQALAEQLAALPPAIRDHFAMEEGTAHYRGSMTRVWRRSGLRGLLAAAALRLAAAGGMLFAETGKDIEFSLRNRVTRTEDGPAMVWLREFRFPAVTRRFDAVMQFSAERGCIVDWLGETGGLEVELHARVIERGVEIVSGRQWLRLGRAKLPLPRWIAGTATIREWLDDEGEQRIRVVVHNPLLGDFFGYEGSFANVTGDDESVPALSVPAPAVVVPVLRWLALAVVAITAVVAGWLLLGD